MSRAPPDLAEPGICDVNVFPWIGGAELAAQPTRGGGGPPVTSHLLQEDGFAILQEDGSFLIVT